MALVPDAFDARDTAATSGLQLIGPAQDQQACGTSIGFALMSAASAAVAAVSRTNSTELSVQNFFFGCVQTLAYVPHGCARAAVLEQQRCATPGVLGACLSI
jgi:hypothetical protein